MIYLTGDTHIPLDIEKLSVKNFPEQKNMTRNDYVIVLGDFGLLWQRNKTYLYWLDILSKKNFTLLWLDGNHENFDWLEELPVEEWNGGQVHTLADNIIHLMRGNVFQIKDRSFFVLGGAPSIDKERRIEGISWWPREEISRQEAEQALTKLEEIDYTVDYVLTHTCPKILIQEMFGLHSVVNSYTESFLDEIAPRIKCKKWFFGHWHEEREYKNYCCLYNSIVSLEEKEGISCESGRNKAKEFRHF